MTTQHGLEALTVGALFDRARWSVRFRVTAAASVFVLLVTAAGSVLIVAAISHTIAQGLVDSANQDAAAIAAQLKKGVSPAAAATTGRNDVVVQLIGPDGSVVASDRPKSLQAPLSTAPGVTRSAVIPGFADSFTLVAKRAKDSRVSLIVVGRSTEQRNATRAEAAGILTFAVPLLVVGLGLILWISIGRALRPVEVMREEADAITAAHLRLRLAIPPGDDEIPRLARTLNDMLDRIDEGQRLQRQFVSDASHELRSPLAVIRQSAEVARAYPQRVSQQELADDVLAESARLEDLVSALLLLARLGAEETSGDEIVDVDDLVLTELSRPRSRSDVQVDAHGVGAGRTRGSAVLLGQVVRNLLDNAFRHASSVVMVTLREEGEDVVLDIADDGPGIAAADRVRIFDRFVRLDDARARDEGGSGLGLAIVDKIVENSGGRVEVAESTLGGARFTVRLPRVPD